jgi:hypothetical protein
MLKKKVFEHAVTIAALWRRYGQLLYFEQIAADRHKFMNNSGWSLVMWALSQELLDLDQDLSVYYRGRAGNQDHLCRWQFLTGNCRWC